MQYKQIKISKLLSDTVANFLKPLGFKKKKEGIFYKIYNENLYLTLGLNESDKDSDKVTINPMFGIGWLQAEELLAELSKTKFNKYLFCSFSSNIGGFTKENKTMRYVFNRDSIEEDVIFFTNEIAPIFNQSMAIYSRSNQLLEGLQKYPPLQQKVERYVCFLYLFDEIGEANKIIEQETLRLENEHPVMRERFALFSKNFKKLTECD